MDFLNVIGDMHADIKNVPLINDSVKMILDYYDEKTKQFRYSLKSAKLPCITAKIISILKKLHVDYSFDDSYRMFFETQQEDGGWRCATVKLGKSAETDSSNPGTTLYVLDALRYRDNNTYEIKKIGKAIAFLLDHWLTKKPLGPCQFGIGTTFMKTEYPFYRYNIFYYTYVLSFYQRARNDKRFIDIYHCLEQNESETGIRITNPHKHWIDILFKNGDECDLSNLKYQELKENLSLS